MVIDGQGDPPPPPPTVEKPPVEARGQSQPSPVLLKVLEKECFGIQQHINKHPGKSVQRTRQTFKGNSSGLFVLTIGGGLTEQIEED